MREPTVKNKYNLTMDIIEQLIVGDRSQVHSPLFWRNEVIKAWCITGIAGTPQDEEFGSDDSFWIGIYDEDAPAYAGEFRIMLTTYGGMCGYEFNKFFDENDIDNERDLEIQEKFLSKINELIDCGILAFNTETAEIGGAS